MKTLTGKLTGLTRLPSSSFGNPRFQFVVDGEIICTAVNCTYGYSIQNHENQQVTIQVKVIRNKLTLIGLEVIK